MINSPSERGILRYQNISSSCHKLQDFSKKGEKSFQFKLLNESFMMFP